MTAPAKQLHSTLTYACAAVNGCRRALTVCPHTGLLVYGAATRLLCYNPQLGTVVGLSSEKSTGVVTCVMACRTSGLRSPLFFATYNDGSVSLWELQENSPRPDGANFSVNYILKRVFMSENVHTGSVLCGECIVVKSSSLSSLETALVATAGLDHSISILTVGLSSNTGTILAKKVISLSSRALVQELRLVTCSLSTPLLVYGGDDSKVHILSADNRRELRDNNKDLNIEKLDNEKKTPMDLVDTEYMEIATLAGHTDWVISLDYVILSSGEVVLVSGSKDGSVRVWRLCLNIPDTGCCLADSEALKVAPVQLGSSSAVIRLDTVLSGHDGWVSHLHWLSSIGHVVSNEQLRLLTCAQTEDRSIVLWQPRFHRQNHSTQTGIERVDSSAYDLFNGMTSSNCNEDVGDDVWVEVARLGEVGGNREGFFSAFFSPDGESVYGHSYQGGIHTWQQDAKMRTWQPRPTPSGHFRGVVDLSWEAECGRYLLTTSLDQTTRLHALSSVETKLQNSEQSIPVWREMCRPQVHGYDLSCVVSMGLTRYIAGAEEKVLRVFHAPTCLISRLNELCDWGAAADIESQAFVDAAAVPCLGLSNKSAADQQLAQNVAEETGVLTEDSLMLGSLWPETNKLYGHGHEVHCVAASPLHIASASRAASPQDAAIIIWCSESLQQVQSLPHHRLTVTQLCFSSDADLLLAVSRDRTWSVYRRTTNDKEPYALHSHSGLLGKSSQHSRIIWSADWLDSRNFITASRDKTVVIWSSECNDGVPTWARVACLTEDDEMTAVATRHFLQGDVWLIATGCAQGKIKLHIYSSNDKTFQCTTELTPCHNGAVRRLAFTPSKQSDAIYLASCGEDNLVLIYNLTDSSIKT